MFSCFIRRISCSMRSRETTYPPSGSISWRSAPLNKSTGCPVHQYLSALQFNFAETLLLPGSLPACCCRFSGLQSVYISWVFLAVHFSGLLTSMTTNFCPFPLTCAVATLFPAGSVRFNSTVPLPFRLSATFNEPVRIIAVQVGSYTDILNIFFIAAVQIAVTSHSRVAEKVLIFQVRTVTPAEYLKRNQVLARFQIFGQVKFSFQFHCSLSLYPTYLPLTHRYMFEVTEPKWANISFF